VSALAWVSWVAVGVTSGLGAGLLVWAVRSWRKQRRKARALARTVARYRRKVRRVEGWNEGEDGDKTATVTATPVTVAELVARAEGEGWAVRLNWDEEGRDLGGEDWPTGVLPRMD